MKVVLYLLLPEGGRREFPVTRRVMVIGRGGKCDLHLNDLHISRRHCSLYVSRRTGKIKILDLASTTGTYVNGKRVREAKVKDGDVIRLGQVELRVGVEMTPEERAALGKPCVQAPLTPAQPIDETADTLAGISNQGIVEAEAEAEEEEEEDSPVDLVRLDAGESSGLGRAKGPLERTRNERARSPGNEPEETMEEHEDNTEGMHEEGNPHAGEGRDVGGLAGKAGGRAGSDGHGPGGVDRRKLARSEKDPSWALVRSPAAPPIRHDPGIFGDIAPLAGPEPATAGRHFSLGMLLRYKWTILLATLLIAVPASTAIWMLIAPKYGGRAEIRVRPVIPFLVFKTEDNGALGHYASFMNTQVAVMRSPTLIQRVLDQPDVQKTKWYNEKPRISIGVQPTLVERLRDDFTAGPRRGTEIIDVTMNALDANDAAVIANAILDQYIKYSAETLDQNKDMIYRKLVEEYKSLENEIEGREKILSKLRKELGTSIPEELIAKRRVRLDENEARLETIRRDLLNDAWMEKELAALIKRSEVAATQPAAHATTRPTSQPARPNYNGDLRWRDLTQKVMAMRLGVETERQRLKPTHPNMIEMERKLKAAEELLKTRQAELDQLYRENLAVEVIAGKTESDLHKELGHLQRRTGQLQNEQKVLQEDAKKQQAEFASAFETAEMLTKENEAVKLKKDLFAAVRARIQQKDMERNVPGSIEVLTRALAPSTPSSDRRIVFTVMVLVLGLGLGLALAFFRAMTSQDIRRTEDLPLALRTPFLGKLPLVLGKNVSPEESPLFREGIRMVRTSLLSRIDGRKGTLIQVTSAGTRAGKSTVALMLARSLAEGGQKVLLVDADLHNSALSRRMGADSGPGFIGTLTLRAPDEETILATDSPRLSLLPAGRAGKGMDLEYIANGAFTACLGRWQQKFDIILMDSPPILPVADARILARKADGSIMVVREDNCRREEVVDAMACLGTAGGKLLGTIFITADHPHGYGYGYSYYGEESEKNT